MRYILFLSVVLCFTNAAAQKKVTHEQIEKIKALTEKIEFLNSLSFFTKDAYALTLNWIYLPVEESSKIELRDLVLIKSDALLKTLEFNPHNVAEAHRIKVGLKEYLERIETTTQALLTFEDYEDSEKRTDAEIALFTVIQPKFSELEGLIEKIKKDEKSALFNLLDENTTQPIYAIIKDAYQSVDCLYEAQRLNRELYTGIVAWVYQPQDTLAKTRLIKIMNKEFYQIQNDLRSSEEFSYNVIEENLGKLQDGILEVIEILKTKEDEESALNRLLSEDQIETRILPDYSRLRALLAESLAQKKIEFETLLTGNLDEKTVDIKKMLKNDYRWVPNSNKQAANEFYFNALIDKLVPIYAKKFSHAEIKEIIKFQESKVGKKLRENAGEMLLELLKVINESAVKPTDKK